MAVTMADISKLRSMTGAGMMDCKNALTEAEGNFEKAIEIIRKKGQAVAAKRSDRQAAEGCVLAAAKDGYAAVLALKCETDFVAKNADFIALTQAILDKAIAEKPADLDALKALTIDGRTIADLVTDRSGVTGEKMELDYFASVAGASTVAYIHPGNKLATIVSFAEANADLHAMRAIAMQVAAMNPIALDRNSVPQHVIDTELRVAIDKTKAEQVHKAVEAALKKAGINPAHVDSEDHMESNMKKGWITAEDVAKAKEIIAKVSAEKAANLPEQMVQNIAQGRLNKFFQESTLVEQTFVGGENDSKMNVAAYMKANNITATDFKRVTLNQE